jgi:hypothetical protein
MTVITSTSEKRTKPRLRVTRYSEIDSAPRKAWLVTGLLGACELSCMYGPPGCGKSVLAGDLAAHVAAGEPWLGHQVTRQSVLFVAVERAALVMRRFAAIRIRHHWPDLPLSVATGSLDLRTQEDADAIIDHAAALARETDLAVGLVVIDTLSRVLKGGDENSPKDMGAMVAALAHIQEVTGAHVLVLHHVPHKANRMRGHGALLAACDATLRVEKLSASRTATLEKSNDATEGAKVTFTLSSIELYRDTDTGQITTAPVVEAADAAASEAPPTRKLSDRQRLALDALANCILDHGEPSPPKFELPAGIKVVAVDAWRTELFSRGVLNPQAKNPREDFRRVKDSLQARHLVGERDGFVWSAKKGAMT